MAAPSFADRAVEAMFHIRPHASRQLHGENHGDIHRPHLKAQGNCGSPSSQHLNIEYGGKNHSLGGPRAKRPKISQRCWRLPARHQGATGQGFPCISRTFRDQTMENAMEPPISATMEPNFARAYARSYN
jgi:hypothetical protein